MFLASLGKTQLAHPSCPFCVFLNLPKATEKPTELVQVAVSRTSGAQWGRCYSASRVLSPLSAARQAAKPWPRVLALAQLLPPVRNASIMISPAWGPHTCRYHTRRGLNHFIKPIVSLQPVPLLEPSLSIQPQSARLVPQCRETDHCGPGPGAGLCSGDPTQPQAGAPRALPSAQAFALLVPLPWMASPNPACRLLILFNV